MLRAEVVLPNWELHEPVEEAREGDAIEGPRRESRAQLIGRRRGQKIAKRQTVASPTKSHGGAVSGKKTPENNARERNRVRTLREAFLSLQAALPSVPPDTKLSKLDVLVLATSYIAHLTQTLDHDGNSALSGRGPGYLHPMKKWPMRARLYAEAIECELTAGCTPGKD
ncbi:transcription factor 23-like [Rana temporaria]|uniref:transcription factor 23-like n=1 Tax=Rana temporaria TaxID=8407 RepID=UPI001AAC8682|nr:transcription factor 23-like [Rana temporaria]XP_040204138.1 transcription factor 23-like [Rana temporaria]